MERVKIFLALMLASALIVFGYAVSDRVSSDQGESPSGVHEAPRH